MTFGVKFFFFYIGLDLNPENTTNHTCFSKKSLEVYILNERIGFVFLKTTTTFPCENFYKEQKSTCF